MMAATYTELTERVTRTRATASRALARHCADPSPISLAVATSAARAVRAAEARWVAMAYTPAGERAGEQVTA